MPQSNPQFQNQISPEMKFFLQNLLETKGIFFSDQATQEKMMQELYFRLDKFITIMIVQELDKEGNNRFAQMLQQNIPQEEIQAFLRSKIPDFDEKVKGTLVDFRNVYLG